MSTVTKDRAERLLEERVRTEEKRQDILGLAEKDEGRELGEHEVELVEQYRSRVEEIDAELELLAGDLEREGKSQRVNAMIRVRETPDGGDEGGGNGDERAANGGPYKTFARYARDEMIVRYPQIATLAAPSPGRVEETRQAAMDRLKTRALENTISSDNEGLIPPVHMAEIMDIIDRNRPVVSSGRRVDLSRGKLTYPKIAQRPEVLKQGTEKTQAGSLAMKVDLEDLNADTYLGAGNISWQTINWSTPDALGLWFALAADEYARATENAACDVLEAAATGTVSPALGTAGTESFADWVRVTTDAIGELYTSTAGRARTDTLYLSADQFFALAALGTDQVLQMSVVGNLDMSALTGTFRGLRVVGSYGFSARTRIIGDASTFLVGETGGAPVEMRAVEPSIGGMEVGVIGAFAAVVFDTGRFLKLNAIA